ncbi:MAG: DUF6069 family protein [Candidatus Promineifilaceae bacterium]|nr:DUF6069 family protein [Candidatus Promineifilaceae bacterium]
MATGTLTRRSTANLGTNIKNGLVGGLVAAVLALILFFVGSAIVGPLEVAQQPGAPIAPLPWFMVVVMSFVPAVVAALLLTALQRFTGSATSIFVIAAVAVFIFMLFPALTQTATVGISVVLILLHVAVAIPIVWALLQRPV